MPQPLQMYRFLLEDIRLEDQQNGNQFLERLLIGPQAHWDNTHDRILAIPNLWSVVDCPDDQVQYLKWIVGWTSQLDSITNRLTVPQLRRLISVSAPLWKERGGEPAILNVLRLLTGQRVRLINWFDIRWILDETQIGLTLLGSDSWLLDHPQDGDSAWQMNVHIVDPGALDHRLVRDVLRLMRATGERFTITYVHMLDLFDVADDTSQWDQTAGSGMAAPDGALQLLDDAEAQEATVALAGATAWDSYHVSAKLESSVGSSGKYAGLRLYRGDASNYYQFGYEVQDSNFTVDKVVAGTPTNLLSLDLVTLGFVLEEGEPLVLRAEVMKEGSTNRLRAWIETELVADLTDADLTAGAVAVYHDLDTDLIVDELTVFPTPPVVEEIGINE